LGNYTGGRRVSGFFKKLRVQAVGRSDVQKEICLDCSKPIATHSQLILEAISAKTRIVHFMRAKLYPQDRLPAIRKNTGQIITPP